MTNCSLNALSSKSWYHKDMSFLKAVFCKQTTQQSQNDLVRIHTDTEGRPRFLCLSVFKRFSQRNTITDVKRHSSAAETCPSQPLFTPAAPPLLCNALLRPHTSCRFSRVPWHSKVMHSKRTRSRQIHMPMNKGAQETTKDKTDDGKMGTWCLTDEAMYRGQWGG